VTSTMVALDRRAMAGGEMDVPTAANGAVVAAPWEEAAEEHGSDVLVAGWWSEVGGCVSRHGLGRAVIITGGG
jgi:hypothetical protein